MPLVIRQIAENARQKEFQNCLALGYSMGEASWRAFVVEIEIIALGRAGILEGSK